MIAPREPGFYWVRLVPMMGAKVSWVVAKFRDGRILIIGERPVPEDEIAEWGPRIEPPPAGQKLLDASHALIAKLEDYGGDDGWLWMDELAALKAAINPPPT